MVESLPRRIDVGGQAVVEGIMMRSPHSFAVVCRRPTGEIVVKEQAWRPLWARLGFLRWPFLRGAVVLVESLFNGLSALSFASAQQLPPGSDDGRDPGKGIGVAAVAIALAVALGLFVGVPHMVTGLLGLRVSHPAFHLVDGLLRGGLLLGYLVAIGRLPEARRLFAYHGAEHKVIYTYEEGAALTVDEARRRSRFHPRCGTSFILLVLLASVALFAAVFRFEPSHSRLVNLLVTLAIKIPLMLPVAGLAYEALRLSARHAHNPVVRALVAPGLWLQRLTTREPDDGQLEIALVAVRKTLAREAAFVPEHAAEPAAVETFPSYAAVQLPS